MTKLRMLSILFLLAFASAMLAPAVSPLGELQASGNTGEINDDGCDDCDDDPEYEGKRGK